MEPASAKRLENVRLGPVESHNSTMMVNHDDNNNDNNNDSNNNNNDTNSKSLNKQISINGNHTKNT